MQVTSQLIASLLLLAPLLVSCRPQGERDGKQHNIPLGLGGLSQYIKFKTGDGDKLKVDLAFGIPFLSLPLKRKPNEGIGLDVDLRGMALAAGLGAATSLFNLAVSPYDEHNRIGESGLKISGR